MILSEEENRSWVVNEIVSVTGAPTIDEVEDEMTCRLLGNIDDIFKVPLWNTLE